MTASATGAPFHSIAVRNDAGAAPTITNATLMATGAGNYHYALYSINASTPTVTNSTLIAAGAVFDNYAVAAIIDSTTTIYSSVVRGTTNVTSAALYIVSSVTRVAASLLEGGVVNAGSTVTCVGAYKQDFTALNAACQ